ncbi:unnamed protein product [Parascedosporium putredinis]|uniref:Dynamin-type G domain-containing protein n=1 Tax=Parascedosporium putredinis TaxID=1442378 RepID=A0A9P1MB37_9PEZI|nr:unnamed protein product [Parascedosporium putredinis]CAI7993908.1 unnamed protein product [Parascedosporium putredinis]
MQIPDNMPNLHSQRNSNLVDIVDSLRRQGIGHYINLPQIIVCGDQSSGKSSALEAISGVAFPAKDTVCTRFATELVLRRAPAESINVTIIPGEGRSHDERAKLASFKPAISSSQLELGDIIEEAKQPHLTIVDLPGLFRVGNREQAAQDSEVVRSLVLSYMKSERAVILAVVSAKSDFALQEVTHLARQLDPDGDRTLGLITKPDTLDPGSESEMYYLQLAQNKDF